MYLIASSPSDGVISREEPGWGLFLVNVRRAVVGALLDSDRSGTALSGRSEVRRFLLLSESVSCSGDDTSGCLDSGCMLGGEGDIS